MYYDVISLENYSELESICKETRNRATVNDGKYACTKIAILGKDAIEKFGNENGMNFKFAEPMKTDGKSNVEFVYYTTGEYYSDGINGKSGFTDFFTFLSCKFLIKYDGVLLNPILKNGKAEYFTIFNDNTDYYRTLPNNWREKNPTPNKVGTITEKKIREWKLWLENRKREFDEIADSRNSQVEKFLAEIRKIDQTKCEYYKTWERGGRIIKNGLEFTYTISSNNVISCVTQVRVSNAHSLGAFLKMAEGKF